MTKLSQCAKCVHNRRNCGNYKLEDDMDCPHYARGGVMGDKEPETKTLLRYE